MAGTNNLVNSKSLGRITVGHYFSLHQEHRRAIVIKKYIVRVHLRKLAQVQGYARAFTTRVKFRFTLEHRWLGYLRSIHPPKS